MKISRRRFLQATAVAATAAGLSEMELQKIFEAIAKPANSVTPVVIWLQGATCSGCITSFLNLNVGSEIGDTLGHQLDGVIGTAGKTTVEDVLIDIIDLRVQQTVMNAAGELAVLALERDPGTFVLVVEGAVPTAHDKYCTVGTARSSHFSGVSAGQELSVGEVIKHFAGGTGGHSPYRVLSVGTCASFGGIPGAYSDPVRETPNALGVRDFLLNEGLTAEANKVVNLPGCPLQPDRVYLTIASIMADVFYGVDLKIYQDRYLDMYRRPKTFYGRPVHVQCERQPYWNASQFATKPGEAGCLMQLGCAGYSAYADCATRGWNRYSISSSNAEDDSVAGTSWCIKANHPCAACSEKIYPDNKYNLGFVKYNW